MKRSINLKQIKKHWALLTILIVAVILRFYQLDFQSPWLDELHTLIETNPELSYKEFYDLMLHREQMPHLYYIIVRMVNVIFGETLFGIRAFSALIGTISVYVIFLLGKELYSKKAGYISAIFLSINHTHIFYSQEIRPYILLCLFTCVSFLLFIKFLKRQKLKLAIYYGLSVGLMISTHFFGLFVLASQLVLMAIFLKSSKDINKFVKLSLISGGVILLMFIPSMPVLLKVSKLSSFWIQPASPRFFLETINGFFGNSEFLLFIVFMLTTAFFLRAFFQNEQQKSNAAYELSFKVLLVWLFVVFMIPYIRSYLNVPMLISRYFISALPAVLILIAVAMCFLKVKQLFVLIISIFVFSSAVDLFIVKDYFGRVNKTQYREMTSAIKTLNHQNHVIVSPWAWHIGYYLDRPQDALTQKTLDEYVLEMINGGSKPTSFWFLDAHFSSYKASALTQKFLDENFYLIDKLEYFDIWTRHYLYKNNENINHLGLNKFTPNYHTGGDILKLISNTTISKSLQLEKGMYRLAIESKSTPTPPIKNQNSHLDVLINEKRIGGFYTTSEEFSIKLFDIYIDKNFQTKISLRFGNDFFDGYNDRDLIIKSISLEKMQE